MNLSIVEENSAFLIRDEDSNMWLARGDYWSQNRKSAKRHKSRELAKESVKQFEAFEQEMRKESREKHRDILKMFVGGK